MVRHLQLTLLWLFLFVPLSSALELETELQTALQLSPAPLDFVQSADGKRLFLLNESGDVLVYTAAGSFESRLPTIKEIAKPQKLAVSEDGKQLYLMSKNDRSLGVVNLDYIYSIDLNGSPYKGPVAAPVTVVLFSEFQCPHCDSLTDLIDQLLQEYPGQIKIVFKNFPLRKHQYARHAAMAALAAHEQGKFWEMHDLLYLYQEELNQKKVQDISREVGLDQNRYQRDIRSNKIANQVQKDLQLGKEIGVRGTPTVFINGRLLKKKTLPGFRAAIEKELAQ